MHHDPPPSNSAARAIRKKAAAERCGVYPTTVMRWATDPAYAHLGLPKPIQLGDGSVAFLDHEIDAWLAARPRIGRAA